MVETQREIPESQRKILDEDADDELRTMERAEELADHYQTIKDRTIDNETGVGFVKSIDTTKKNGAVSIKIDIPSHPEDKQYTMSKARLWTYDYQFVRWVEYYGYNADSFPSMIEDRVKVKLVDKNGEFEIYIPPKSEFVDEPLVSFDVDIGELVESYIEREFPVSGPLIIGHICLGISFMSGLIKPPLNTGQTIGVWVIPLIILSVWFAVEIERMENAD